MLRYNAATPEELWNAFENVLYDADFELDENVSVTEFMKSWTEQTGYPLINVMKVNDTFVISQVIIGVAIYVYSAIIYIIYIFNIT